MDLWGPYCVQSLYGNHYLHGFLDDCTHCAELRFLKHKSEGVIAKGLCPEAIHCDRGTEFINEDLISWLREQGIQLQLTAPHSPSQNGAAERLNHTLVELARAMMIARNVPQFLWEYAIKRTAYICDRASTKSLSGKTPYEAWHGTTPDVSHLREFGSPIYVLIQGPKEPLKLQPKSKQQLFVSYDNGSKSVKYYNPETRKVLTTRNFKFLTNFPETEAPAEPIVIDSAPVVPHEGERGGGATNNANAINNTLQTGRQHNLNKQQAEELTKQKEGLTNMTKTPEGKLRNKNPVDYKKMNDPFGEVMEKEIEISHLSRIMPDPYAFQAILGTEDPLTVAKAKTFDDWPQWEAAIQSKLQQLHDCGT